jgi:uncharacterized protein with gpF-like domain
METRKRNVEWTDRDSKTLSWTWYTEVSIELDDSSSSPRYRRIDFLENEKVEVQKMIDLSEDPTEMKRLQVTSHKLYEHSALCFAINILVIST